MKKMKEVLFNIRESGFLWKKILPLLPAGMMVLVVSGILLQYETPSVTAKEAETIRLTVADTQTVGTEETVTAEAGTIALEDGLYQGSGKGYGGLITVAVEVTNQTIQNIWVLDSTSEDAAFFNKAKVMLPEMVRKQSAQVDTVSGATYSSKGLIAAVTNALTGKQLAGVVKSKTTAAALDTEEFTDLTDGVFTGSAKGYGGTIKVQITVASQKITNITILEAAGETPSYLSSASVLTSTMIEKQSTNVDVVSGATYSSKGIIKAVRRALEKSEGLETEEEDTTASESGTLNYPDGVYYGTGDGYAGDITVAIAIADKTLKSAIITKSVDDDSFLTKAKKILDKAVLKQTYSIDAVSGATYSSKGILEALKEAFKEAKKAKTSSSTETASESASETTGGAATGSTENTGTTGAYKDGTYSVSVPCSPDASNAFAAYTLNMKVTIAGDKVTGIADVSGSGTSYVSTNDSFIKRAVSGTSKLKGMTEKIVTAGGPDNVDVVSGATCTSQSILAGTRTVLLQAKNPSSTTSTETTAGNGGTSSSETASETPSVPATTETATPPSTETSTETNPQTPAVVYKDGEYTASAVCNPDDSDEFMPYDLSLTIKIEGGKITGITNVMGSGSNYISVNSPFIQLAATGSAGNNGVTSRILAKQSVDAIDVVSGATCTSNAMIQACKTALGTAKQ